MSCDHLYAVDSFAACHMRCAALTPSPFPTGEGEKDPWPVFHERVMRHRYMSQLAVTAKGMPQFVNPGLSRSQVKALPGGMIMGMMRLAVASCLKVASTFGSSA